MTETPMTPLPGYTPASKEQLSDATKLKHAEERVLRILDDLYESDEEYDGRWLAIARTHIQQGFMAAVRGVMQPSRIGLPEDLDDAEGYEEDDENADLTPAQNIADAAAEHGFIDPESYEKD